MNFLRITPPRYWLGSLLVQGHEWRRPERKAPPVDEWIADMRDRHLGERCFIIATGPSLNQLDLKLLKGEVTFGVNGTYMIDNIDLTYFVYVSNWWHKQHIEGIKSVRCARRFLPETLKAELDSEVPTTWYRKIEPKHSYKGVPLPTPPDFSVNPDRLIYAGGTVVFVCLQLAYFMGFKEVVIVGLDHSYSREKDSSFKKHRGDILKVSGNDSSHFRADYVTPGTEIPIDLAAMERGYAMADLFFRRDRRRILNASAQTQLEVFPRVSYKDLFR